MASVTLLKSIGFIYMEWPDVCYPITESPGAFRLRGDDGEHHYTISKLHLAAIGTDPIAFGTQAEVILAHVT